MIDFNIKKLYDDIEVYIPKYMTDGACGFDIASIKDYKIFPYRAVKQIYKIETGLAFEVPKGYEVNIRARSGLSLKYPNYIVMTGGGTIDYDYRGPINVYVINNSDEVWEIKSGHRIAQCILSKVEIANIKVVEELSKTKRGSGGFGHTGK